MDMEAVADLDGVQCAAGLADSQAGLVAVEWEQVALVAHWCDLHSTPRRAAGGSARGSSGGERSVVLGGDGTPVVAEFAADELGALLAMTTTGARGLMRDVLDLRHRHPRLWAAVGEGRVRFFAARQVARSTHAAGLSLEQARGVDDQVAGYVGSVPWGRMVSLVEGAVIAADPEAAEQRRLAAEMARFVRTGRSNEYGTTTIFARARAGDAIFFMAMCDRIAQILKLRGHPASQAVDGPSEPGQDRVVADQAMDVLRSEAIGILARPAQALALLAWAERTHPDPDRPQMPDPRGQVDPDAVRSPATLYVHVSHEAFTGRSRVGARVEGVGPITVEQAVDWLRHCQVTLRPVIDLNANPTVDGYPATGLIAETARLRAPVEVFPYGTTGSRRADLDHTRPYQPDGPPGQTNPDNLGPLGRHHHRVKTHGAWQCWQTARGIFYWQTPHGHWLRVDGTGTTYLGATTPLSVSLHSFRRPLTQQPSILEQHVLDLINRASPRGTPAGPAP